MEVVDPRVDARQREEPAEVDLQQLEDGAIDHLSTAQQQDAADRQ